MLDVTKASQSESEKTISQLNSFYIIFGKVISVLYADVVFMLSAYPLYTYLKFGQKDDIINVFVPLVDRQSTIGHWVNLIAQFIVCSIVDAQYIFCDLVFFYYLFFAGAYEEVVEHDCKSLKGAILEVETVLQPNRPNPKIQKKLHSLLVTAVKRSQGMNE